MTQPTALYAAAIAALALPASASIVVVDDGFDDGGLDNGADPADVAWLGSSSGSAITLAIASPGADNALSFTNTSNNRSVLAYFDAVELASAGDFITLSFDVTFQDPVPSTRDDFTFSLLDSGGTQGNTVAATDDDFGYNIAVNPGSAAGNDGIGRAQGTSSVNLGRFDSAGVGEGSANVSLTLTRNASGEIDLVLISGLVGETDNTYTTNVAAPPTFTFDLIEIGYSGSGAQGTFLIDNVLVTTNVPEPGAMALVAAGLACGLARRRS